jgi:hypothetical protein
MRVEVQLERSVQPIVHEDVLAVRPGETGKSTLVFMCDGSEIAYPYRNYSWLRITHADND